MHETHLAPNHVPIELHSLIPLAEKWGIDDYSMRSDFIKKSPRADSVAMKKQVESNIELIEDWLAGPLSDGPDYTLEYLTFTCLVMAADAVKIER
ncbi:hypothetical protein B1R32_102241 [Abditibacterium utsteinense]|uniref:Uncharacterized protein n=1 Tax=Abditibacterium utsteinense TaxID=1960156 RepID=A0A2S8SWQ5_9BACT|nr:hypothetical protein [Abditibacterium utsteinense]PQV65232.1 hypothetical protein B1R32_102241 [Abditibacterium utsteinense]